MTNAFSIIGINPPAGHFFFLARKSPLYAYRETHHTEPLPEDLPALRMQSDIAWGFWNRVTDAKSIRNILAFWAVEITNGETNAKIHRVHGTYSQNGERTLVWPGVTFDVEAAEGQALLGTFFTLSCTIWQSKRVGCL